MEAIFLEKDLPVDDLQKLGLYQDGKPLLDTEDLQALLSGRRTDLISLTDLQADGFLIEKLDAKLSLEKAADGTLVLKAHPIYKEVQEHPLLTEHEAAALADDSIASIRKIYGDPSGKSKTYVIEYDHETKEFVSYQPENVQAPDKVNGETLTDKQKADFKNGDIVNLSDGTSFQHRASERKGILSDRKALILSVILDGGISYLLITGIRHLIGAHGPQRDTYTKGYQEALEDMEAHQRRANNNNEARQHDFKDNYSRGYGRGSSR